VVSPTPYSDEMEKHGVNPSTKPSKTHNNIPIVNDESSNFLCKSGKR
jgi:hypothetical protein